MNPVESPAGAPRAASGYDVVGLGGCAVDDLLYVDRYPSADAKVRVLRRDRQCGGLTATALVAAARLGARAAYAGTLGYDPLSAFVVEELERQGVDCRSAERSPEASPVLSTIIVDAASVSRTVFAHVAGRVGAHPRRPAAALIRAAAVLHVDHFGVPGMLRAARIARAGGVPVVADFEADGLRQDGFPDLLATVDHLILGHEAAAALTGCDDPEAAVARLWAAGGAAAPGGSGGAPPTAGGSPRDRPARGASVPWAREMVAVTCGPRGYWYAWRGAGGGQGPVHAPAFAVKAVDTTGCGDVFRGAYCAALAQGAAVPDALRRAAAAAALKATAGGGQSGIPTPPAVEAFLRGA